MAFSKIPDTGSFSVGGTKYWAISTCIVRYYYHFYTRQRRGPKIPDSPVKYRTSGNPAALIGFYFYVLMDNYLGLRSLTIAQLTMAVSREWRPSRRQTTATIEHPARQQMTCFFQKSFVVFTKWPKGSERIKIIVYTKSSASITPNIWRPMIRVCLKHFLRLATKRC